MATLETIAATVSSMEEKLGSAETAHQNLLAMINDMSEKITKRFEDTHREFKESNADLNKKMEEAARLAESSNQELKAKILLTEGDKS